MTARVSYSVKLLLGNVAAFPDLSNYFGEHKAIITNISDGQSYENKVQLVIK